MEYINDNKMSASKAKKVKEIILYLYKLFKVSKFHWLFSFINFLKNIDKFDFKVYNKTVRKTIEKYLQMKIDFTWQIISFRV